MKKLITFYLCIMLSFLMMTPLHAETNTLQDDGKYHVVNVTKEGKYEIIKTSDSYAEAKVTHTLSQNKYHNLGITYGKNFLSINSGLVSFKKANDCSVNVSYTNDANNDEGYTNGCYGGDAAFLEYNTGNDKVKFRLSGVTGWVSANHVTILPFESVPNVSSFIVKNKELFHQLKADMTTSTFDNTVLLGKAPNYLKENTTYYSYDTHYFYTSYETMIKDYRNNKTTNAINASTPYYNYYQYLSQRSTSSYSVSDLSKYLSEELMLKNTITAFENNGNNLHNVLTQSMLVQGKEAFFQYQNQFGANAMMMLALSMNETANGRSLLAYTRNNLFGHAAYDSDVEKNAARYASVADSIYSHAKNYISASYMNPKQFQYHGGQFGNKAGGMNVLYASDPYWGEKAAQYFYSIDKALGNKEENQYTFGITNGKKIEVKKEPSEKSTTLYSINAGDEASLILLDKQQEGNDLYYLVQSDASLSNERSLQKESSYNFKKSYGYVKADSFKTIVNEKKLQSKIYVNLTFDANGGNFHPNEKKITLQCVSGTIPTILAPTKDHALFTGWNKSLEKADVETTYTAVYKEVSEISLTKKPKTAYFLNDYLEVSGGKLHISFKDGSSSEVDLTTDMVSGYDRTKTGKQLLKITYAGCTMNYEIQVTKKQDQQTTALKEKAAYIIKNYSDKTNLTDEGMMELTEFKDEIMKEKDSVLSIDTIRAVDRILQANANPRYSVVIDDDTFDLQVSGLSLGLTKKDSFIHNFMPRTIVLDLDDTIAEDDETMFKKVANANGLRYDAAFSISGKDDFSGYNPESEVVYSIQKPKDSKNRLYRIYYKDGEDIVQAPVTQSEKRILFKGKTGSFAVVSIQQNSLKGSFDFTEVNTIKGNGKNYINQYILLPSGVMILLVIAGGVFLGYRKKQGKTLRKTKDSSASLS